jgi:predicted ATPase
VLVSTRGLYASGKFDQYKHNMPYATLAQSFQSLVRSLLSRGEVELGRWRNSFVGQLIANLVPELATAIGASPAAPRTIGGEFRFKF